MTMDTIQLECNESNTHMHKCVNHCVLIFSSDVCMILKV